MSAAGVPATPFALVVDAYRALGWRLVALLVVLPVSALIDGYSLALLFPLLSEFGIGSAAGSNVLAEGVQRTLDLIGVPHELGPLLVFVVVIMQFQVAFTLVRGWLESDCQTRYVRVWQDRLFKVFISADWVHSIGEKTAAQVNAILTQTGRISAALYLLIQVVACGIMAAVYAGLSVASAWQVTAFLGVFGVLIYLGTRPLSKRGKRLGDELGLSAEDVQQNTQEFLGNMKLIKATATERIAADTFGAVIEKFRDISFKTSFHPKIALAITMALGFVLFGSGIWLAASMLKLAPAAIVVSIYVFMRLYTQVSNLQGFRQSLAVTLPALPLVTGLFDRAHSATEPVHAGATLAARGPASVSLRDVEVRYGDHVALSGFSAALPAGSVVGITGPSGAGKSTVVDTIVGLVRPFTGEVEIDGRPLRALDISTWRRSVGYVAQDTLLFRGTVAENIAWGHGGADREAVREAAKKAHADDFIQALPAGYETIVGDRGVRLSGGQRQRLGLARALLGDKRLLILDEATSALDSESEAKVLDAVANLRGRVTILMVAHRLSTLRIADRILVLEAGRLTEAGSFADLVAKGGHFARLWQLQSETMDAPGFAEVLDAAPLAKDA